MTKTNYNIFIKYLFKNFKIKIIKIFLLSILETILEIFSIIILISVLTALLTKNTSFDWIYNFVGAIEYDSDNVAHLVDLGSLNGTRLKGEKVSKIKLLPSTVFQIGQTYFEVFCEEAHLKPPKIPQNSLLSEDDDTVLLEGPSNKTEILPINNDPLEREPFKQQTPSI